MIIKIHLFQNQLHISKHEDGNILEFKVRTIYSKAPKGCSRCKKTNNIKKKKINKRKEQEKKIKRLSLGKSSVHNIPANERLYVMSKKNVKKEKIKINEQKQKMEQLSKGKSSTL